MQGSKTIVSQTCTKLRACVTQTWTKLLHFDRRIKLLVLFLLVAKFASRSVIVVSYFPSLLWFGADACVVWHASYYSTWKPSKEEWWHKLCRLEKLLGDISLESLILVLLERLSVDRDMEHIEYICQNRRHMGNRLVCFDNHLVPKENCLVYSFGIDYDFRFDDAMAKLGCTVYSFDPSMNATDHKHSDRVNFKATGLSATDDDHFEPRLDSYVRKPSVWRMRRLATIMEELGHVQGSLTVLKVDIEAYEWDVVADILSTEGLFESIPQVLIEWHLFPHYPPRSRYDDLLSAYFRFKDTGFRKFFWGNEGRNHYIARLRTQAETGWINKRFIMRRQNPGNLSMQG